MSTIMRGGVAIETVPCRYCGKGIVWGKEESGTNHPLDPVPPVYAAAISVMSGEAGKPMKVDLQRVGDALLVMRYPIAFVSHYATCPGATRASADAKAKRSAPSGSVPRDKQERDFEKA